MFLKPNSVHHSDCLEVMSNIQPYSVDLILCDLPYGKTLSNHWDCLIPFDKLWEHYKRILKPTGVILLFAAGKFFPTCLNSNIDWFKYDIVWAKNNVTNFANAKRMPMRQHEKILMFCAPGQFNKTTYNPQGLKPYTRNRMKAEENIGKGYQRESLSNNYVQHFTGYPTDIIHYDVERPAYINCQKPLLLLEYLIKTYSNKGDLVLDNAAGSGGVGLAARNTDRNYMLIEKDKENYDIINMRLSKKEY